MLKPENKKKRICRVGFALYKYNPNWGTGTERIAMELARNLANLKQSTIEYKFLLRQDVAPSEMNLPGELCLNAPQINYSLISRAKRKFHHIGQKGIDIARGVVGMEPRLGYLGELDIKEWLHSLGLDLIYFPSMWYSELVRDISIAVQLFDL